MPTPCSSAYPSVSAVAGDSRWRPPGGTQRDPASAPRVGGSDAQGEEPGGPGAARRAAQHVRHDAGTPVAGPATAGACPPADCQHSGCASPSATGGFVLPPGCCVSSEHIGQSSTGVSASRNGGIDVDQFVRVGDNPAVIMVGADGSPTSLRAGAYAAGMARRQGARLAFVYVAPRASPLTPSGLRRCTHRARTRQERSWRRCAFRWKRE
jgi:hypothetical protein